ncbi:MULTISPECIES: urease accessory protein UreD [Paeniglutamicibacter]|uniref:Urease accessory protein UreD n=1 Tax=Paeniglutamicibacter sulfureus TaxID=43666 RepID=A0ABU2BI08_9MICC|nr:MULTISPECIES: urease accessory protein UreD [Paeniglutamicibacter]MCV9995261.1 urease accessory protein UreD [Paeniglutamicibacter sp. ZC-3]MDO2933817.1 urease accessory protein UreD [Paeniglutamicibacter sulfureus]MDR7358255.1 urease accessory protein [Paeniglutamicibacter sulfureus]
MPEQPAIKELGPSPFAGTKLVGELRLQVGNRAGKAIATRQYHQGALRILRPHYLDDTAQVCYTIVNPGGGYLGGDNYGIEVSVDEGASLLLTTQSATKVYKTPGTFARQDLVVRLDAGAVLEYVPDQLIAYRGADYRQFTTVDMHRDSSLLFCEVLTPGWSPDGKLFRYDEVRLRTEVCVDGRLAVLDNLLVRPGADSLDSLLFLQDYTHVGMLLAIDANIGSGDVERIRDLAYRTGKAQRTEVHLGISKVPGPGVAVRALSNSTEAITAVLMSVVDELRHHLRGQKPLNLRKY